MYLKHTLHLLILITATLLFNSCSNEVSKIIQSDNTTENKTTYDTSSSDNSTQSSQDNHSSTSSSDLTNFSTCSYQDSLHDNGSIIIFQKTFTHTKGDSKALSIKQTNDCGYIIGGRVWPYAWLIKTDKYGKKLWEKLFEKNTKSIEVVHQTQDGGYLLAGQTWISKIDSKGELIWITKDTNLTVKGKSSKIWLGDAIELTDRNYVAVGSTYGGTQSEMNKNKSKGHAVLLKYNSKGKVLWKKYFGGPCADDSADSVLETKDRGLIFVGKIHHDGSIKCSFDWFHDVYVVRTDINGKKIWEKEFGGPYYETGHDIVQKKLGRYGITGSILNQKAGSANSKMYYLEIDDGGTKIMQKITGTGKKGWAQKGNSLSNTSLGGIAEVGETGHQTINKDLWVVKFGPNEDSKQKTFGGKGKDIGSSIELTADGGFIIGGYTCKDAAGNIDCRLYFIKTDKDLNSGKLAEE